MREFGPKDKVISLRESAAGAAAQTGGVGDRARRFLRGSSEQALPVTGEPTATQLERLQEAVREFQALYPRVMGAISIASEGELSAEITRDIQLLRERALYIFRNTSVTTADLEALMEEMNTQLQKKFGVTFPLKAAE